MSAEPDDASTKATDATGVATPAFVQDPDVLAKRAQIAKWVKFGKRYGYAFFGYAMIAFIVGAIVGFTTLLVDSIVVAIAIGSVLLIPAIVFGYGIKSAEREDRDLAARAAHGRPQTRP